MCSAPSYHRWSTQPVHTIALRALSQPYAHVHSDQVLLNDPLPHHEAALFWKKHLLFAVVSQSKTLYIFTRKNFNELYYSFPHPLLYTLSNSSYLSTPLPSPPSLHLSHQPHLELIVTTSPEWKKPNLVNSKSRAKKFSTFSNYYSTMVSAERKQKHLRFKRTRDGQENIQANCAL